MKVTVYFETPNNSYAVQVAMFDEETTYMACLPALEKLAKANGFIVTESVNHEADTECV